MSSWCHGNLNYVTIVFSFVPIVMLNVTLLMI